MSQPARLTRLLSALKAAGPALAVAALVTAAFLARLQALRASPFPTGVDGFFYLLQVRSLLEHGQLYSPSAPLVPWLMAGLSLVTGPVLAMKMVAALGSAALITPAYLLAKRLSHAVGPALLGAAMVATSAQSIFLSTEFVKQAVGLSLAMGFVAGLAWLLDRPGWRRGLVAAGLLVASALAHKMAVGLAVLWTWPLLAPRLWNSRRSLIGSCLGLLALLWIARKDLAVFGQLFQTHADLSFAVLTSQGRASLVLGHEVALAAMMAFLVLVLAWLRKPKQERLPPLVIGFCAFALFQALPWINNSDDQGVGYRLRLASCACLGPCAAVLAKQVLGERGPRLRLGLLVMAIGLVLLRPWSPHEGVVKAHPAMVEATRHLRGVLPPGTIVVIPERHTAFMAAYYGDVTVRLRPPTPLDPERTVRLLPGAAIRPALAAALDRMRSHPVPGVVPAMALHSLHPNGLVLFSEPTFQYLVAGLPTEEQRWYQAWPVQ
jgi:hypothetical protein